MRPLLAVVLAVVLQLSLTTTASPQMLSAERVAPSLAAADTVRGEMSAGDPGVGLALAVVFPGAGHYYAGELRRGLVLTGGTLALAAIFFSARDGTGSGSDALAVLSGVGLAGLYAYNIYDAPRAVRRQNALRR